MKEVVASAEAALEAEATAKSIQISAQARADFKAEIERQWRSESAVEFIYLYSHLASPRLNAVSEACKSEARKKYGTEAHGNIISGVAGIVVAKLERNSSFDSAKMIDLAIEAAARTAPALKTLGSMKAWGKFRRKSQRLNKTRIHSKVDGVSFYPIWIQLRDPGEPNPSPGPCPSDMVLVKGTGPSGFTSLSGHKTVIDDMCMHATEVSVDKYGECKECEKTSKIRRSDGTEADPGRGQCTANRNDLKSHPINCVSWKDAKKYCQSLRMRLPSEWEWEWAARGRDEGRVYPWGPEPPSCERAQMNGCAEGTAEVGHRKAGRSRDGISDLAGNVWEWTDSPAEDSSGDAMSVRGGSWYNSEQEWFQAGYRGWFSPVVRGVDLGFRCVTAPKQG